MFLKKLRKLAKIKSFLLFLLIFLNNSILPEGFMAGTLVKTKDSYIPIEQLKENTFITSYKFKNKVLLDSKITKIKKQNYKTCIKLIINGKEIISAPDHKFFCPLRKGCWIKAQDLQQDDFILRGIKDLVRIESINKLDCDTDFYCLSIADNHNYFVSEQDVFVHNAIPIVIGTFWGFEFVINVGIPALFGAVAYMINEATGNKFEKHKVVFTGGATGGLVLLATRAPGKPGKDEGYEEPKRWDGEKVRHKDGGYGYPDNKGNVWIPSPDGHGGGHWDVVDKKGDYKNVYPGGHERKGQRKK